MKLYGIEFDETTLRNKLIEADRSALQFSCFEYRVVLCADGSIDVDEYTSGNSFAPASVWRGEDHVLTTFCYPNLDIISDWFYFTGFCPDGFYDVTWDIVEEYEETDMSISDFLVKRYPDIYDAIIERAVNEYSSHNECDGVYDTVIEEICEEEEMWQRLQQQ